MSGEDNVNLRRKIVEKGVKQLLDEAKVPMQVHLGVVRQLRKALDHTGELTKKHEETLNKHKEEVSNIHAHYQGELQGLGATLSKTHEEHTKQSSELVSSIEHVKKLKQGEPGLPGLDAEPIDEEAIISKVLSKIPAPEKGDKGDAAAVDVNKLVDSVIRRIQKGDVLHVSHVKGASGFIKDGIRYRFEEFMHGGGSSSGSGGFGVITVTGTINDSNVTFTATTTPVLLNINGSLYRSTGGAITWSYSSGTITLSSPVGTGGSIYGIGGSSTTGGNTFVIGETVAGAGTGWTLANTPVSGTLALFANGQRLMLTTDYTISGANITTILSWTAGSLLADYQHS